MTKSHPHRRKQTERRKRAKLKKHKIGAELFCIWIFRLSQSANQDKGRHESGTRESNQHALASMTVFFSFLFPFLHEERHRVTCACRPTLSRSKSRSSSSSRNKLRLRPLVPNPSIQPSIPSLGLCVCVCVSLPLSLSLSALSLPLVVVRLEPRFRHPSSLQHSLKLGLIHRHHQLLCLRPTLVLVSQSLSFPSLL